VVCSNVSLLITFLGDSIHSLLLHGKPILVSFVFVGMEKLGLVYCHGIEYLFMFVWEQ
jgi:hypothetical protein